METNDSIQRRIKRNQMQRRVRRNERALRTFFGYFRLCMFILIILFTYKIAKSSHWYVNKEIFNSPQNEYLKIEGNQITPDYKILEAIKQVEIPNKPIYLINTNEMSAHVKKIAPIKRVYIRRFWWPARFIVMVQERKPIILISPSEKTPPIAFFAEGGKLIDREYLPLKHNYHTTLVLSYGTRGDDYSKWDEQKVKMLDKLAKTLASYSGEKVLYVDLRNPHDVYAQLSSVKLRIGELDATVFKRIQSISSILPRIKSFGTKVKYVDLRWEETYYLKMNSSK